MKPMPHSARQCATCCGVSSMSAPSASSTSALPDFDDTLRLPCLATRAPAAAATNIDAVEILKVCAPSPPVPTMSIRCVLSATGTGKANSRITVAAPAISPTVSFLTRKPLRIAAVMVGETSPRMICRIRSTISSWKISRCSIVRCRACCGVMGMGLDSGSAYAGAFDGVLRAPGPTLRHRYRSRKFFNKACPCSVRIDSGWNCTPSTGCSRWRRPMISSTEPSSFSVHAVTSRASGKVAPSTTSE